MLNSEDSQKVQEGSPPRNILGELIIVKKKKKKGEPSNPLSGKLRDKQIIYLKYLPREKYQSYKGSKEVNGYT